MKFHHGQIFIHYPGGHQMLFNHGYLYSRYLSHLPNEPSLLFLPQLCVNRVINRSLLESLLHGS